MKESFGGALANGLVKNLARNADVDPRKIAIGLVVTAAGAALNVVAKEIATRSAKKAIRETRKHEAVVVTTVDIPDSDNAESSDED